METKELEALILAKTRRVVVTGEPGDGSAAARQFDAVALCAGFACSRELLERLSGIEPGRVIDTAAVALEVVREQAGDHVRRSACVRRCSTRWRPARSRPARGSGPAAGPGSS